MFTKLWFRRVAERAVMTFAQTATALYGVDYLKWAEIDPVWVLRTAGIAAILSVGTSVLKSKATGDPENPGLE